MDRITGIDPADARAHLILALFDTNGSDAAAYLRSSIFGTHKRDPRNLRKDSFFERQFLGGFRNTYAPGRDAEH
jgi:hypothetical protein